jgi:hypothetical protein
MTATIPNRKPIVLTENALFTFPIFDILGRWLKPPLAAGMPESGVP